MRKIFQIFCCFLSLSLSGLGQAERFMVIESDIPFEGKKLSINISTEYREEGGIYYVQNIHIPKISFPGISTQTVLSIPLDALNFNKSPNLICELVIIDEKTGNPLSRVVFEQEKRHPVFSRINLFLRSLTVLEGEAIFIDR